MGGRNAFLGRVLGNADRFSDEQVAQTVTLLIEHGVKHRASDIHIEPHERFALVRYRIDNVLRNMHKLPLPALPAVTEQIKTMADMMTDSTLPQEGQFATLVGEEQFEIHIHTMPVLGGEKTVMRIARRLDAPLSLEALGYWGPSLQTLQHALSRTHGMVLVATPRRHGRTTTLHSLLSLVNAPSVSVATVENSLEYRVAGASQTIIRTRHGLSMIEGVQAALKQDPNVLLVSDIADKPTVNACVHAAASGHAVIGGMHADTASEALLHLQQLSDEHFLLGSGLRAIVSQRLVRKLCAECRRPYKPSRAEIGELEQTFGIHSPAWRKRLHQLEAAAIRAGMGERQHNTTPGGLVEFWQASAEGCDTCHHTGYRGMVGINEVLSIADTAVQPVVLSKTTAAQIEQTALKEDFIPLRIDGLIKALRGQTTLTEILRILSL